MAKGRLLRLFLVSVIAVFFAGCSFTSSPGGLAACLDDVGVQGVIDEFWADSFAANEKYAGQDFCLEGIATFVESKLDSVAVTVSVATEVGVLLSYDEAREPENYRALAGWAEQNGEGDIIRVVCRFVEFAPVEGAPEPMIVPVFGSCNLAH